MNKKILARAAFLVIFWAGAASAQQSGEALPILASDPPTPQTSYEARVLRPRGVHYVDPNVYAYTAEFARRFQMPEQWVTPDLQGAEAVAFRVMPGYKSCGWGGNPAACREDEVRCFVDVYFDHQKQPLPWDERMPSVQLDINRLSAHFLQSYEHPLMLRVRPQDHFMANSSPFIDAMTGKGLGWQEWKGGTIGGWTNLLAYDREIFRGMALISLFEGCHTVAKEFWLTSKGLSRQESLVSGGPLAHKVVLPDAWITRIKEQLQPYNQKASAFYRTEGMKAMQSLHDKPVPQVPILTQQ
jgi:hypothetical protein